MQNDPVSVADRNFFLGVGVGKKVTNVEEVSYRSLYI